MSMVEIDSSSWSYEPPCGQDEQFLNIYFNSQYEYIRSDTFGKLLQVGRYSVVVNLPSIENLILNLIIFTYVFNLL